MEMKITIETRNDVWHFEIEDKEFGERVKWGESDSFTGCAAVCLEFVAENKIAAEQSVQADEAYCVCKKPYINKPMTTAFICAFCGKPPRR